MDLHSPHGKQGSQITQKYPDGISCLRPNKRLSFLLKKSKQISRQVRPIFQGENLMKSIHLNRVPFANEIDSAGAMFTTVRSYFFYLFQTFLEPKLLCKLVHPSCLTVPFNRKLEWSRSVLITQYDILLFMFIIKSEKTEHNMCLFKQ